MLYRLPCCALASISACPWDELEENDGNPRNLSSGTQVFPNQKEHWHSSRSKGKSSEKRLTKRSANDSYPEHPLWNPIFWVRFLSQHAMPGKDYMILVSTFVTNREWDPLPRVGWPPVANANDTRVLLIFSIRLHNQPLWPDVARHVSWYKWTGSECREMVHETLGSNTGEG